jgi:hypothetical protein
MAATRTRDILGTCRSEIAIDPCAGAIRGHRKCARLGGASMITISIFWALVFALFTTKVQQPHEYQKKSRRWFRPRRHWHDPMLVLNMSIFNSKQ